MIRARRAVVTGVGVVSPLGRGPDETWAAVMSGRSGITRRDDGRLVALAPATVFTEPTRGLDGRPAVGRAAALAAAAVRDALGGSELSFGDADLIVGTTMGVPTWIDSWPSEDAVADPPPAYRASELLLGAPDGLAAQVADLTGVEGRVSAVGGGLRGR